MIFYCSFYYIFFILPYLHASLTLMQIRSLSLGSNGNNIGRDFQNWLTVDRIKFVYYSLKKRGFTLDYVLIDQVFNFLRDPITWSSYKVSFYFTGNFIIKGSNVDVFKINGFDLLLFNVLKLYFRGNNSLHSSKNSDLLLDSNVRLFYESGFYHKQMSNKYWEQNSYNYLSQLGFEDNVIILYSFFFIFDNDEICG